MNDCASDQPARQRRGIRSYVIRGGRLTPSQQKALDELWPAYGLNPEDGPVDRETLFGRRAELVLEIGFGMGDALIAMAQAHPERDFIGVEVHPPGVGTLLRAIREHGLANVRVFRADARLVLERCFKDDELDRILIFFPDPWHKKRHHKRRLIQPEFVQLLGRKLAPGGQLHLATDWENYAAQMMEVMGAAEGFGNRSGAGRFARHHDRPETKFERRGRRLGHDVRDLIFVKES